MGQGDATRLLASSGRQSNAEGHLLRGVRDRQDVLVQDTLEKSGKDTRVRTHHRLYDLRTDFAGIQWSGLGKIVQNFFLKKKIKTTQSRRKAMKNCDNFHSNK